MLIQSASSEPLLSQVREIFREYQMSLGIDLCFQNFEQELSTLPGKYALPQGRIYLAFMDDALAGCIALRPLQKKQCENETLICSPTVSRLPFRQIIGKYSDCRRPRNWLYRNVSRYSLLYGFGPGTLSFLGLPPNCRVLL